MAKTCIGSFRSDLRAIETFLDAEILQSLENHRNPAWWKKDYVVMSNRAYLLRWGALLRREARRRGLL